MLKLNRFIVLSLILGVISGCEQTRPKVTQAQLLQEREQGDVQRKELAHALILKQVQRVKSEYPTSHSGTAPAPPVLDILIISGGGDWGAFGAGFLKGWSKITGPLAKPQFDTVTGVSTGALIAPFAFLGDDESIEKIVHLYRNPHKDWVKQRWPLYFLPSNISFAAVPGLERELRENLTKEMIARIAKEGQTTRVLLVNTSSVDDGGMRVWDMVAEAQRAVDTGDIDRFHRIMLASAGIPAAFPFRIVDDEMLVDGGVTGNILYGGRMRDEDSFTAIFHDQYPQIPIPKIRYWIVFNNQLRPLPQVTEPNWPAVMTRSLEMGTRSATLTAMRHLFAQAEIAQLKRGAEIEVRVVAVPDDFVPPKPGVFVKETMNALVDLGEKMGADPNCWRTEPP